ncbi:hypothetical protein [Streptomyces sp. NPDC057686]|uniref:hypothetical protein n=1 Tax=Streptomyces sp. NPDC057686 TaxID=3346212 RepID=UPI003691D56B
MALAATITVGSAFTGIAVPIAASVSGVGAGFAVYASAARTATPDGQEFELPRRARAGRFVVDVTAKTASPSVVFTISGVDRTSGKTYPLFTSAAVTSTGTTVLKVDSALAAATNVAKDTLPPVIRIQAVHGNSDSITYSVSGLVTG